MNVVSLCQLPVASLSWEDKTGAPVQTIVVKATYRLQPGTSPLAEVQDEVRAAERAWDDDPSRGIHAPNDLVPSKPGREVVLVGSAFAPGGEPSRRFHARLIVGTVDKTVAFNADRSPVSGFGPIAAARPDRQGWLDPLIFMCSPGDQRLDVLRPDERIVLENLHRTEARLVTRLAGIEPRAVVERDGSRTPLAMTADTLWIDTDRAVCTVTWRAVVALESRDLPGSVVVAMQRPGRSLPWSDSHSSSANPDREGTLQPGAAPRPSAWPQWLGTTDAGPREAPSARPASQPPRAHVFGELAPAPPPAVVNLAGGADADVAAAAKLGAAAASTAAAGANRVVQAKRAESPIATPRAGVVRETPREHVLLLWFDHGSLRRICARAGETDGPRKPRWTSDTPKRTSPEDVEQQQVLAALVSAGALDASGLAEASRAAYGDDGSFAPPVVAVSGELALSFGEVETLRAMVAVATPFASSDKRLREAIALAAEVLAGGDGLPADVVEGATRRIEESFSQSQRPVAPGYLDASVERILLQTRSYLRKSILGETRIRGLLTLAGGGTPFPAYLPEALGPHLPLFRRFRVKAIVEVRPQEDQYETHGEALVTLALARLLRRPA